MHLYHVVVSKENIIDWLYCKVFKQSYNLEKMNRLTKNEILKKRK